MFIFDATPEAVKPAAAPAMTEVQFRGWMDEMQALEADARDLADEMTEEERQQAEDDYWAAMDEATLERMAGEARYADMVDSGLMPW